jgi:hypothetical protein
MTSSEANPGFRSNSMGHRYPIVGLPHHRTGENTDSQALRPRPDPRHPGSLSDDSYMRPTRTSRKSCELNLPGGVFYPASVLGSVLWVSKGRRSVRVSGCRLGHARRQLRFDGTDRYERHTNLRRPRPRVGVSAGSSRPKLRDSLTGLMWTRFPLRTAGRHDAFETALPLRRRHKTPNRSDGRQTCAKIHRNHRGNETARCRTHSGWNSQSLEICCS